MRFIRILLLFLLSGLSACQYRRAEGPDGNFPREIANILIPTCATPGCHSAQSSTNAAGLNLSSWEDLMRGSRTGAAVVPYAVEGSFLFNFVNTYADLGPSQTPVMPPNGQALSREEVNALKNWIRAGAPDKNGRIAFTGTPYRQKVYVVNQGCDVMSVIDIESGLLMRSVPLGKSPAIESPHSVRIRPDGKIGYVVFLAASFIQYFDTETDQVLGEIEIGAGEWNTIVFSTDNRYAFAADFNPNGKIACADLQQNKLIQTYGGSGFLVNPHGQAYHPNKKELWVAPQYGNFVYRLDVSDPMNPSKLDPIILDNTGVPSTNPSLDPHEIMFSPDGQYLYTTCSRTNELRISATATGQLLQVISTGLYPQELTISGNAAYPYLALSCMEDSTSFPQLGRGSVKVLNWKTFETVSEFYPGFQPHGLVLDERSGMLWVANRNVSTGGPAPHHSSSCGGSSGYVNRFNASTGARLNPYPIWLSVDPYGIAIR